ncbi:MAG: acyl-CoA dehydrogenase family protein [Anaerolineales bacterium]|nr:acyl-CoA dehydrogenase family protein [Anaerolineales bacterium]
MTENFFLDNQDLQFRLKQLDLRDVLEIKEQGYAYAQEYGTAPRNYADAMDNYHLLLEVLGDICANIIAPRAAEADEEGAQFIDGEVEYAAATQEAILALKQADLFGAMLPWKYGGLNLPETIYQMMIDIVSRAESGVMTVFGLQEIASTINEHADDETKDYFLPRFARGEVNGAMVLTEPDAGSDLGSVQTRAFFDEEAGTWRLNGVKRFITNGNADVHLILARSEAGSRDARGLSLFLLERDETVRIRRIESKLGIHASPTCEVQYDNTPAIMIGKQRFGLIRYSMALMNGARLAVGAQAIGIAEAAYREAYSYAHQRIQFNQPIAKLPAVSRMLLSMRAEIEASRALVCETGIWVDRLKAYEHLQSQRDKSIPDLRQKLKEASNLADVLTPLTKYYASEMGNRVCYVAMQIHGGVGYMNEFNIERLCRDVRVTNIYEGTSQLQIVAAIGKLLGHALDDLLDKWAAVDYGSALDSLKKQLAETTMLFKKATDALKEKESDIIDFYAADLADIASFVVISWLLLQDALVSQRRADIARVYIGEHVSKINALGTSIMKADKTALLARETILAEQF